ncbi:MAG: bifunctional UDP-sugar hydrolase/5'-nucleotidase [Bacteroidales bacterium]|jgi:2',3'-cyclic-nucleotide 2'-phosphodiesterase/3'-nucleotidase
MKRYFFYLIFILFVSLTGCTGEKIKDGNFSIEIYATNDLHGRLFDSLYTDTTTHPFSLSSVSTYIKGARERAGESSVILLDIGDHLQGDNSVFYYNYVDTKSEHIFSKVVNYLKYDAVVVGNHDIEAGHTVYDKIVKELNPPYLTANATDVKTGKPYFEPYTIIVRQGIKIAVIGMTNPNISKWLSQELWSGMRFEEIIPLLENLVADIQRKEKPQLIIAALHAGLGNENIYQIEDPAKYVAKNVKGIDVVMAAHDHKTVAEFVKNGQDSVLVMEGGSRASSLSFIKVNIKVENGEVVSKTYEPQSIPMKGISADNDYTNKFHEEFLAVKKFTNTVVGRLENTVTSRDSYFGSSEYIDMIHTIQLEKSNADISFAAPLSLDITIPAGELNYQDLLNLYPFENQLYVIEMTGKEIKDYLEYSYSKWINQMKSADDHLLNIEIRGDDGRYRFKNMNFNFDSAAGIIYEVDVQKGDGERITIKSMADGKEFNPESKYKVALSSYRANGGGDILEQGAKIPRGELDSRVVSRSSDIRGLIYDKLKQIGSIKATRLNQWKFVPEKLVNRASIRDYNLLFKD